VTAVRRRPVALGFAPHSGWAALVALAGDAGAPEVVRRERIEMTDGPRGEHEEHGAAQPYHAVEGRPLAEARRRIEAYEKRAAALASAALKEVMDDLEARGFAPHGSGILQSSGRAGGSLEAILASHALIHTADGNHFRDALATASGCCGLPVVKVPQKELPARASVALRRTEADLAQAVLALGKAVGPPWGADQKSAALVAWLLLAKGA
jgi:hypothetical protein